MKKTIFASAVFIGLILQGFLAMPAAAQTPGGYGYGYGYQYQQQNQYQYCVAFSYNLYQGLTDSYTGGQVSQLQQFLASQGYSQPVTGYFGPLTRANVAQFQRQYAIYPITGGVGPLTRAAIARLCNGSPSQSSVFYLNQAFTIGTNQTLQQYNGQLDFTLNSISMPLYTTSPYPGYNYGQSATITLGLRCQAGTQCLYYPTQQFTLTVGQSISWQNYTVTLNSLSYNSANFTVTGGSSSGTTQGSLSANPISGQAPLNVSFSGAVNNSGQYIIDYGDGQNSGPMQSYCPNSQYSSYCSVSVSHTYANAGTYTATLQPYIACMYSNPRCMIATVPVGQVSITVSGGTTIGGVSVTSPSAGQTYVRGQDMTIAWSYPVTPGSTQMALELYTSSGSRVGLIAVSSNTIGSYTWHIPGYPQNYMCTLQYPNGLCGTSIPTGQYYVKVSATNNPLDANPTVIASGQSGVFTIQLQ